MAAVVLIDPVTTGVDTPLTERLRPLDPADAVIRVTDLGVTRGDGVFETIAVVDGHPQALRPHLERLAYSARMLALPDLDLAAVEAAVLRAVGLHGPAPSVLVKVVVTHGVEGTGAPTAWAHAFSSPDYTREQTDGVAVVSLDRGYRSDVAETSPWLLQGAKTLSYAINRAALREAARRGADDVVFVSTDGLVLEGPTSSVLARFGDTVATPPADLGILAGTTQAAAFAILGTHGLTTEYRPIARAELDRCDGLWLVSSGRQVAPVHHLDDRPLPVDRELTAALLAGLLARTE